MSQENQSPNPRESTTVRQNEPGFPFHEQSGDQPLLTPSARVSIPETPGASHRPHRSRPTSSNASASSPPKLNRRKSSFIPSEESDDSDEYSDDSKNSKKRAKRKGLKKRTSSYRRRSEDIIDNNNEEDNGNDDGNNDQNDSESDREFTIKDRQERYALVLRELSYYIFWPFGKYVEKIDEWSEEDDEHSVSMNHHGSDSVIANGNGIDIESNNPLLGRRT
ncbi:7017_t:CDS:2, partial [Racocetra fulgida]